MQAIEMGPPVPGHSLEAEEAVIGGCLVDPEAIAKVDWLLASDFYREKNQWVWAAILELHKAGVPTDQVTVAVKMAGSDPNKYEASGGFNYLMWCIQQTPTSVHVKYYADIVRQCSDERYMKSGHELPNRNQKPKEWGGGDPLKQPLI